MDIDELILKKQEIDEIVNKINVLEKKKLK